MPSPNLSHLDQLEAEASTSSARSRPNSTKPVMLYSIGKDSAVMLHLALKAFYPGRAAVPAAACRHDLEVPRDDRLPRPARRASSGSISSSTSTRTALERGIGPFSHGSALHTDVMKTEALKQALDKYGFDAAFGGARRDEEKSRAKERIFSFRSAQASLGPEEPAPRAVEPLQHPHEQGRDRSASSRCPTGPSSTSGNTSTARTSRSCRSISPPSGRWSSATAS